MKLKKLVKWAEENNTDPQTDLSKNHTDYAISHPKVTPELSKYFSELGKKGGKKLLAQRGREYYVKMAAEREARRRARKENSE